MRKSQVTIFIIIGMIILILVVFSLIILDIETTPSPSIDPQYLIHEDLKPVRVYIESCLDQTASPIIESIASGGGTLFHDNVRLYEGTGYRYLCQFTGSGCMNKILKREDMEDEISWAVRRDLEACIDLGIFREQGFSINSGEISVNTTIILYEVKIDVNYPLVFERGSKTMRIDDFSSKVEKPLGKLYLLTNSILNQELSNDYFDHVGFMKEDYVDVKINKKRPYPDVAYSLTSDDLNFNFALEGVDTVSQIDFLYSPLIKETDGCCYITYDNICYKNVPRLLCEEENGIYDPNTDCKCPEIEPSGHDPGYEFRDCRTTYNISTKDFSGPAREHGESWCNYGSIAGQGRDYVGSRHYVHYCIDGVEYVEECRDFREGICAQETGDDGVSKALCRPNRWEDCSDCKTRECCRDSEYRDCFWIEGLFDEGGCVPEVPPGLRFWEESGKSVCSKATQEKECSGFSCGDEWVTSSAELCIYQGDCGNYRNIHDVLTEEGFYHTDLRGEVDDSIYNEEGLHLKGNYPWLDLSPFNRKRIALTNLLGQDFEIDVSSLEPSMITDILSGKSTGFLTIEQSSGLFMVEFMRDLWPRENFLKIMSSVYSYLDALSSVSLSELKEGDSDVSVKNVALCDLWRAPPLAGDCSACHESEMYSCTEYICHSLGQNCVYEEGFGRGRCHDGGIDDETIPVVTIDREALGESYIIEEDEFVIGGDTAQGYKIKEGVSPLERLSVILESDKETICRMSYMPKTVDFEPAGFYVSSTGFNKEHKTNIYTPPEPEVPQRLIDFLNASDSSEFIGLFAENKEKIEELEEDDEFKKIFENIFGEEFYKPGKMPELVKLLSSGIDEYRQVAEKIFNALERGEVYMFFYCQDRAGNENKMPQFLRLPIKNKTFVEEPPEILGTEPEDGSKFAYGLSEVDLKFYLSEPSICRYAFEDMDYEGMNNTMDCTFSRFDIQTEYGGSYLCQSTVEANESVELYVRCRDNPERVEEFDFSIKRKPTSVNKTKVELDKRTINEEIIKTDANNTEVVFYMDDPMECSLAYSPGKVSPGNCGSSGSLEIGQYNCVFDMSTNESVYEELAGKANNNISEISGSANDLDFENTTNEYEVDDNEINESTISESTINESTINESTINDKNNISEDSHLPYNISANILCRDRDVEDVNINQESFVYKLKMSEELKILNHAPRGDVDRQDPAIVIETSDSTDINCGYSASSFEGLKKMESLQGNRFSAFPSDVSKGRNEYIVRCRDAYGNEAEQMISFYYVG